MTAIDPSNQSESAGASPDATGVQPIQALPETSAPQPAAATTAAASEPPVADAPDSASAAEAEASARRRILIGSQRNPAAYRVRPRHDLAPLEESDEKPSDGGNKSRRHRGKHRPGERNREPRPAAPAGIETQGDMPSQPESGLAAETPTQLASSQPVLPRARPAERAAAASGEKPVATPADDMIAKLAASLAPSGGSIPRPSVREKPSRELEDEFRQAMGDASMDDLLGAARKEEEPLELESLQSGQVVAIRRDDVFVEFGGRHQGIVSLRQFDVPPQIGATVQIVIQRQNPEDGLYELTLPNRAVQVDDWSDLVEGAMVEVHVTGHNTGGLECEVNHIRGFIPVSQIGLYRVEDLAPYVDQRLVCIITESDPNRRNLVVSRRAVLEREREQARQQLLETLKPGQVRDGVVRKLMDFGAFVDLGGVDGLIHISQLAWGRVKHASDVLQEGQAVKVRVEKIDPATNKISLGYRDLMENPWTTAAHKYPPRSTATGTVTKLMDFGAFVEIEPGIEGLVHISELSHKRVWRCSDMVKEGQQVEVMVLSVDTESQRMSLSMKELSAPPEPVKKPGEESPGESATASKKPSKPAGPLLGGLGRKTGERFGLKW